MDMPVNVPVDDPNADTEWNDILRKHGVIPEKPPSPTPMIEEALIEGRRLAHEHRLEGKDLAELDELEDEEDEAFLGKYREQRIAELAAISKSSIHGHVYPLQKPDYNRDVTEASHMCFVLVLLTSAQGSNVESRMLEEIWQPLATRYGDVKFSKIRADMCIEGYPEKNCPTILVYRDGNIVKQVVRLRNLGGLRTRIQDLEELLVEVDAINRSDSRYIASKRSDGEAAVEAASGHAEKSDDEDWD